MLGLALRTLRFRKGGFLGTFVALFFGSALVLACAGLMETGIRTATPPQRLAHADLQVVAPNKFEMARDDPSDEDDKHHTDTVLLTERVRLAPAVVDQVKGVQGVRSAEPDVSFPVAINGVPTTAHGSASTGKTTAPGQVWLPAGAGEKVTVSYRGKSREFDVAGTSEWPVFADKDVAELAGRSTVDSVSVVAIPGTDLAALSERLSRFGVVLAGDDRGLVEHPDAEEKGGGLIALAGVIGGLAITTAVFVVASTLGLSVRQRSRELALLRAIGTTPGQLRRMVLNEALLVGVVATVLGCVPGRWIGELLFDELVAKGVVSAGVVFHQGWIPMIVAVGSGLLTTVAAALVAARRAARTRPTEALTESSLEARWLSAPRAVLAFLALGGGLALAIVTVTVMEGPVAASTAGPSVILWAIALALVSPGITRFLVAVLRWPLRAVTGVAGELGLLNARARTVRLASAVTPIMLATGIATANIYLQTTQVAVTQEAYAATLRADAVVTSTTGGLPVDLADRLRATPGITAATALTSTRMYITAPFHSGQDDDGFPTQAVSGDISATTAVTLTEGTLDRLSGNAIAAPQSLGYHPGDSLTVRLGDGAETRVTVTATFTGVPGFETILAPTSLVLPHTTTALPQQILLRGDTTALAAAIATTPDAVIGTRESLTAAFQKGQDIGAWVNYTLVGMIIAYTVIAVINTLAMSTTTRRREFALQRLTGSTRPQVLRMMTTEALLTTLVGLTLGTAVSAGTLIPFTLVVRDSLLPLGPLWIYLAIATTMALLTLTATLIPTWRATKTRPITAATLPD
ncbi:FtsX-like permease family protein [Actinokineospora terrae]|uniref:Putative ABC transport system permease protein n=1 Tax=Actinokineospora terrae TaxID=155974 RepID=A0A1H9WST6_9PSEU|nr:ABC transporter permease [Actinokineospora terrae]SES37000.1 putative ABC transport system permease protein [Actinokineospora terrae]